MKKLTNVSPFLLLLVPIFMMMVLTLVTNGNTSPENETALKSAAATTAVKISNQILK
ncbi:MAG TPA: hypothetical protein VGC08_15635 [Pedobacter sp.]